MGLVRECALTLSDLGDVLTSAGRPTEALTHLREAGTLLVVVSDPYNHARALTRLGRACDQAGDTAAAGDHLRQALRGMRDIGSTRGEAEALTALGDLAERGQGFEEARRLYTDAEKILVRLGHPQAAQVRERLARLADKGEE